MKRALQIALFALTVSPLPVLADEEPARLIRAEPSIAEHILGAPYALVSLTAWPLKKLVMFMEDVNLPARAGDVLFFPVRVFASDEES